MGKDFYSILGVDRSAEYEVTLDNAGQTFRVSGRELAGPGLTIRLDSALTSELVLYERTNVRKMRSRPAALQSPGERRAPAARKKRGQ